MYCTTHDYTTTNAEDFKKHLSDNQYHYTPYYTQTLKNVTIIGTEGATVNGFVASSGHVVGPAYDYVRDYDLSSGSLYYYTLKIDNLRFENVDFTAQVNICTSQDDSVYDGVTFEGCDFTTGGTASANGAAIRYYNEINNGNVKDIVVTGCTFNNCNQGVYVHHVNGITVTGCEFDTTGHNAIAMQGHDGAVDLKTVVITGNTFNKINDRVIRFNNVGADSDIKIQNNIMVNSGDDVGELIKATSVDSSAKINLEYNYWNNKEVSMAVASGLTAPTNVGIISGTWNTDVSSYVADGYASVLTDGKYVVEKANPSISAENVGFDSVKVGYTQPDAKEVTVENNGNVPVTLTAPVTSDKYIIGKLPTIQPGQSETFTIQPVAGLAVGNYEETFEVIAAEGAETTFKVSFLVYQPSSGGSSKPVEEPVEPEIPEEPEVPTEEPVAGEVTVETEVTDGGEVEFEAPVEEPEAGEGETPAAEDEAKITGVVLPTGTEGKVEFVPISEQAAPEGKETQTKKVFEINVPTYEKGKPATIKFTMTVAELAADGKEAADVALWHFDEETGEWTKLVTSYTIVDGVVYFEAITNDFSPFAIVYEDEPVNEPVEEPKTPASPAPVLAVLAALGAAVVLRRK